MDHVDRILEQWQRERPDLDASPMGVIGRLSRAAASAEAALAETFARNGLDASTFDVIATLGRQGPPHELTPAALAADSMISTSAVAQRLNRMEARGLVTRSPRPDDGRGRIVRLTPDGRALLDRILPAHLATEEELLSRLDGNEREVLAALLSRLDRAD